MEIFLVRHGETNGNVAKRHQAEHTQLSTRGEAQAEAVAAQLVALQPTHLLTSDLKRAIETARIIGERCDLVPEVDALYRELGRPRHLHGRYHRSPASLWFYARWYVGWHDETDGETYQALRTRIGAAQARLGEYPPESRIVLVTHSVFMNLFVSHLCRQTALWPHQALRAFSGVLTTPNTHVVRLLHEPGGEAARGPCQWRVGAPLEN